ncbi:MAG: hypothetical protein J7M26_00270 [Armatimonadetes bacterium]|nr:hypothetical protein [Armatimonadota bacterium]
MTRRALFLGLAISLALGLFTPYSDLVLKGTWIGLTAFPISAIVLLTVLVALVNVPLRAIGRGLTPAELIVVYACALVAAGLPSFGWTGLLIPYLAGPFYYATPENKFAQILLPHWPSWLHPSSDYAIDKLYEGLRPGEAIPWGQWVVPLAAATVLGVGLFACYFALSALLRRRWVEEEKLVFPLMELPGELVQYSGPRELLPALLRNKVMWGFFALPFFVHSINGLHFYWPAIPQIPVYRISLDMHVASKPWTALSPLWLRLLFSIIALAYLLPGEVSLSLWVFFFFFLVQQVIGEALGFPMPKVQAYPVRRFVAEQMIGGILTYGVLGLVGTGPLWLRMWRQMWSGGADEQDAEEAMKPGVAGWTLAIGFAVLALWGAQAGAGLLATAGLMALYLLLHLVAVRLVCEAGMLSIQHPYRPLNLYLAAAGTSAFRPRQIAMLALLDHFIMLDNRSPTMPGIMQSLKLADRGPVSRRALLGALVGAVAIAVLSSYVSYLYLMYKHGGATLHYWFTTYYAKNLYATWTTHLIRDGEPAHLESFGLMAVGAATMLALTRLHHLFTWWPLSPVGYLMGVSWPMLNFWFPIFVGWMIKTLVLHYGGPKTYRALVPGFLGWVLAEFFSAGLWVFIDALAGVRGHQIFTF